MLRGDTRLHDKSQGAARVPRRLHSAPGVVRMTSQAWQRRQQAVTVEARRDSAGLRERKVRPLQAARFESAPNPRRPAMFHRNTTAGDICSRIVSIAYPALSVEEAARVMREQHVGCLVVVEEITEAERRVVGMLTDRDIVVGGAGRLHDAQSLRVGDLMSRDVVSAREDDSLLDVLSVMRQKAVRRMPVVAAGERLVGVIAIDDLLEIVAQEMQALAAAISAAQRHASTGGAATVAPTV